MQAHLPRVLDPPPPRLLAARTQSSAVPRCHRWRLCPLGRQPLCVSSAEHGRLTADISGHGLKRPPKSSAGTGCGGDPGSGTHRRVLRGPNACPSPCVEALTQGVVWSGVWKVTVWRGPEGGPGRAGTGGKRAGRRAQREERVSGNERRVAGPHGGGPGCLCSWAPADAYVPRRLSTMLKSAGPAADSKM